ncbi:V-type proton ATPase subunit F [Erysiphe necator]|nr:V-type proton ATPase subunit F [Erysiphe necator]
MAAPASTYKDREFLAIIGDEVWLLTLYTKKLVKLTTRAGFSYWTPFGWYWCSQNPLQLWKKPYPQDEIANLNKHVTAPPDSQKNFLVVDSKTDNAAIEEAFDQFTSHRKDIGIVLINQHIAERIRHRVDSYTAAFPALLEIPSKDYPYDPEKDSVLRRVRRLFGE